MSEALNELGTHIELKRHDSVLSWVVANGELTVTVLSSNLVGFVEFLKTDQGCQFSSLVDITAVDYPSRAKRFDVVYHFLSMYQNHRIRIRVSVREEDMVPSIVEVHPSANWFEREVFDMFGIRFAGHHMGEGYSVQANMMLTDRVVPAMAESFESSTGPFEERLMRALEAAEAAGGDIRGRQSATIRVVEGVVTGRRLRRCRHD